MTTQGGIAKFFLVFCLFLAGCGGTSDTAEGTIATVSTLRGDVTVLDESAGPTARVSVGGAMRTGEASRARALLDTGARLLVDEHSALRFDAIDAVTLTSGRVFLEALSGDAVTITLGESSLRVSDAALSIRMSDEQARVYAVRGEVSFVRGEHRGVLRAGEEIVFADGSPTIAPVVLYEDWTGGLMRPGPDQESVTKGMGALEARVPDEIGMARWALTIRRLDVRVRIDGDFAITEVEQEFFNPASETVEGLYRLNLPEGAVLQRFAVDRNGTLVDGYVREQQQARAAYEAQVYRGSTLDPALLEWEGPGRYHARIYPIAGGEVRRIAIRYALWLAPVREGGPRLYRYPMGGGERAPHIEEMSFVADLREAGAASVRAGMGAIAERDSVVFRQSDFRPRSDLWIELEGQRQPGTSRVQHAYRAVHSAPPRAPGSRVIVHEADERDYWFLPLELPSDLRMPAHGEGMDWVIVADISAAMDRSHLELGRSAIESLAAHFGPNDRVNIVGADLSLRPLVSGEDAMALGAPESSRMEALLEGLSRVAAGGASDLGEAFTEAARMLDPSRPSAIVYVGDGAPTVGELAAEALIEQMGRLPHPIRLYAMAIGADANLDLLSALTSGGGLAMRVTDQRDAAAAVLDVLAHAERPLLSRVTVDLGSGIDNAFPRRPVDVVLGDVLTVVGRVREQTPTEVVVRGEMLGEPFERRIPVSTENTGETTDLRLRWAQERLHQLLLAGATREEVAELGTRYGLITPYTSYYVPSARELAHMGSLSRELIRPPLRMARVESESSFSQIALGLVLGPLALGGCDRAESPPPMAEGSPGWPASQSAAGGVAPEEAEMARDEGAMAPSSGDDRFLERPVEEQQAAEPQARPAPSSPAPPAPTSAPSVSSTPSIADFLEQPRADSARASNTVSPGLDMDGTGRGGGGMGEGTIGLGQLGAIGHGSGSGFGYGGGSPLRRERERSQPPADGAQETQVVTTRITTIIRTTTTVEDHVRRRCSEAASRPLEDRRALWRERLSRTSGAHGWLSAYSDASRDCEMPAYRDRRAFLQLILEQAGNLQAMIDVYRLTNEFAARDFLRREILRRVRSPADLALVRTAFGPGALDLDGLAQQVLARAQTPAARLRALRALVIQRPDSIDLKLRLLEEIETQGRHAEAIRLASQLRLDPMADAGVRTAIGEMYLRFGREADARRAFSEIVEFAPLDELARRRLGDLYRAHGWYTDAYRQYVTLAAIRPDDPSVLLLLARAAAGAGRIDEALRLEQRLMEMAEPGAREGLARVAQLWSSVRFAKLRDEARRNHDDRGYEEQIARMRHSGVLRGSGALRVALTWSHPDAQISLFAAHPGLTPTRPEDLAPELGIEAFEVAEQESAPYRIEVRRDTRDRLGEIEAELIVLWNEGRDDEQIMIVPLRLGPEVTALAWTIAGRALNETTPSIIRGANR
jgi:Ca-activated chloride channel family protein